MCMVLRTRLIHRARHRILVVNGDRIRMIKPITNIRPIINITIIITHSRYILCIRINIDRTIVRITRTCV